MKEIYSRPLDHAKWSLYNLGKILKSFGPTSGEVFGLGWSLKVNRPQSGSCPSTLAFIRNASGSLPRDTWIKPVNGISVNMHCWFSKQAPYLSNSSLG